VVHRLLTRLALGVFIGKDDFTTLGRGEQGALAAAPIFREFMKEALADQPATPFRIPQGIVLVPVDAKSGTPEPQGTPGSILEAFKPGTEPGPISPASRTSAATM